MIPLRALILLNPICMSSILVRPPFSKMEFPKFGGDNPRLWRDQCEIYFEVYAMSAHLKTRFAA